MAKKFSVTDIVNSDGCFDLQFRKDTRHNRTNSPTYYRWKAQFVVTSPKNNGEVLKKIKKQLRCGNVSMSGTQARFSVQKISDIYAFVIPFFRKNSLAQNKKKDFELWTKGVEVIYHNKGKHLAEWKKNDICTLIEIHKSSAKYKLRPRTPKWFAMAKTFSKTTKTA